MLYITRFKKRVIYNNMEKFHGNLPKLKHQMTFDDLMQLYQTSEFWEISMEFFHVVIYNIFYEKCYI